MAGSVGRLFGSLSPLRGLLSTISSWLSAPVRWFLSLGSSMSSATAAGTGFSGVVSWMSRLFNRLYPTMIRAGRALWAIARPILAISGSILAVTYSMNLLIDATKKIQGHLS